MNDIYDPLLSDEKTSDISSNFSISPAQREDKFAFTFFSYIEIATAGEYTFYLNSDDGSKLYINNELIVDNDGLHAPIEKSGKVSLTEGRHQIRVGYFENTGEQLLEIRYAGPGINKQLVPDEVLFLNGEDPSTEVWLEAECASVGDYWKTVDTRFTASGGSYLQATVQGAGPDNLPREDSRRQIAFTVETSQAGTYQIFARQRADNSRDNSFFFQVNDGDWQVWSTSATRRFGWSPVADGSYQLNEGVNTIRFANRESEARLDNIYVTQAGKLPTGFGEAASNCDDNARLANQSDKAAATSAGSLVAYPNPTHSQLTVQIPNTEAPKGELVITDLLGKRVRRNVPTEVSGRTYRLDVRELPAGMYLLQWQGNKLFTTRVLVER